MGILRAALLVACGAAAIADAEVCKRFECDQRVM